MRIRRRRRHRDSHHDPERPNDSGEGQRDRSRLSNLVVECDGHGCISMQDSISITEY